MRGGWECALRQRGLFGIRRSGGKVSFLDGRRGLQEQVNGFTPYRTSLRLSGLECGAMIRPDDIRVERLGASGLPNVESGPSQNDRSGWR